MTIFNAIAPGLALGTGVLGTSMMTPTLERIAATTQGITQMAAPVNSQVVYSRGVGRIFEGVSDWIRRRLGQVPPPPPPAPQGSREEMLARNQKALRRIVDRLTDGKYNQLDLPYYSSLSRVLSPRLLEMEIALDRDGQFVYCHGLRDAAFYRSYPRANSPYRFPSGFNSEHLTSWNEEITHIPTRSTILMDFSGHLIEVDFTIPKDRLDQIHETQDKYSELGISADHWLSGMIEEATLTELQRRSLTDIFDDPFHLQGRQEFRRSEPYYRALLDGGWEKEFIDQLADAIDPAALNCHKKGQFVTSYFAVERPGDTYRDQAQYQYRLSPVPTAQTSPIPPDEVRLRVCYRPARPKYKQHPSFGYTVMQGTLSDDVRLLLDHFERTVRQAKFKDREI